MGQDEYCYIKLSRRVEVACPESTTVTGLSTAEKKKQDVDIEHDVDEDDEVSPTTL